MEGRTVLLVSVLLVSVLLVSVLLLLLSVSALTGPS
jgi:hypothetical protein